MQLSVLEAAQLLNVTPGMVYSWIKQGAIPFSKVNDEYLFNRTELLEWATSAGLQISGNLFGTGLPDSVPLPNLSDALGAGGVFHDLPGTDLSSVLKSIVDKLKLPEDTDRTFLFQVLLARESLGSTGIGNGIAIPHVRNPVVLHSSSPSITLCFLRDPIDFKAIDGKPVHTLFTIISPTVRSHLHLLSRLSYLLSHPEIKAILNRRAGEREILDLFSRIESGVIAPSPE
jgi:nitrogen PTS system EIIA component